jgi:hypothetical protein
MKLNKHNKNWKIIIRWIGTILSILLLVYLFYTTGIEEIIDALKKISLSRLLMMMFLIFVSRLATFLRWHSLLHIENLKVHWKDSLRLTFAGLFASNFLPTTVGGDVVRLAGAMRIGISGALAAASLMTDRLVGIIGMALVLPFGLSPLFNNLNHQAVDQGINAMAGWAFGKKIVAKVKSTLKKVAENFRYWFKHPKYLLLAMLFNFIHMAAIFLIIKIIITELGESMSFWEIAGLWSLTYFVTLLPISINGLGLQEVTITNLFTALGGLSNSTSLTIAIIIRGLWILGSLPGAFFISGILSGENYSKLVKDNEILKE